MVVSGMIMIGWAMKNRTMNIRVMALCFAAFALAIPDVALADKISNPIAIFSGLDKITGRIISFEAAIDETVEFGAFLVTPRVCFTRPITQQQNTTAFVEVDEITVAGVTKRLFGGWVFASSPGLHGVEHPIYDVWLIGCKGGTVVTPELNQQAPVQAPAPLPLQTAPAKPAPKKKQ